MAREDLNPVEEARACAALVEELGLTREDVGLRVGRSRVAVSNLLRLLDLPDEALELLERGDARPRATAARCCSPTDHADRRRLARSAVGRGLVGAELEARAREANDRGAAAPPRRGRAAAAPRPGRPRPSRSPTRSAAPSAPRSTVTPRGGGYRVELRSTTPTRRSRSPAACARARSPDAAPGAR